MPAVAAPLVRRAAAAPLHNSAFAVPGIRGMSFARTKIQPPRPRSGSLIPRPALEDRLTDALLEQRLVLVCAAAGYGKTTLLAQQLMRLPIGSALAWVSADEGDDLHRLLECLVAALEPFDLPWRTAPEALVAQVDDARGRLRAAAELLNALDACDVEHGIIVFDDVHRVDDGPFFGFVDALLERLTPRWTIVVAARHDPPLALARLRALGELTEFRQAELGFDRDEARRLAETAGVDDASADALHERTQGWPAGLRLGLTRGAGRAPGAGDRAMFDFLATEVIDQLDPELRLFLLQTSVLPELTAARAAAVSGNPRAAQLLDQVDRLGLFVSPLDAGEPTFKLHDLFREALAQRLQRECPAEWRTLWQRAAAGETDPSRQVAMLLHGGDHAAAAEALAAQAPALLSDGALSGVAHLVDQFPGAFVAASPVMQLVLGRLAWARWNFGLMLQSMQRAETGFEAAGDGERARLAAAYQALALNGLGRSTESAARLSTLRRERVAPQTRVVVLVACIWHALDLRSTHRVGPLLDELMDRLEASADPTLWYQGNPLPRINGLPGTAKALQRFVTGAMRLAGERPMPLRALALAQSGWQHAWQDGDLEAAEQALATAQDDSRWLGDPPNVKGMIQLLATFVYTLRGERARALAAAQALIDDHPAGRGGWSLWANIYYAARVAALFGERELLGERLARLEQGDGLNAPAPQLNQLEPLRGQRAWLAGDADSAIRHWQNALVDEASLDRLGHGLETRLFLAAALVERGRADEAAAALKPAFERVAAGAGIGGVLLAHAAVSRLAAADWRGRLDSAAIEQLRRWQARVAGGAASEAPAAEPLAAGGLSGREIEVLARIAAGDSNKLIARAFDLSPHTVKRHVANILDKLGADSRGQAAAWYRSQR
jgi:LuxR family transcriptional regulator, maltose regulon positive regulatory protein